MRLGRTLMLAFLAATSGPTAVRAQTIRGVVVDSATNTPIAKARVDLSGTTRTATTDARGRFAMKGVLLGTYSMETRTPELDAIGATNQSTLVFRDSTAMYQIRVPKPAQLASVACSGRSLAPTDAVILGRVFQRGDTIPAAGVSVVAEWTVLSVAPSGTYRERNAHRLEGKTASDGMFRLCGVPRSTVITLTASTAAMNGSRNVRPTGTVSRADLVMDHDIKTTATFAGKIVADSTKTPVDNAEIYFPDLSKMARSGTIGEFRMNEIPAGAQHVLVRRFGFAPLDTVLAFDADRVVDREIVLSRVQLLDSVVVTDRLTPRIMQDFEDNRRVGLGTFLNRAELGTRDRQTLSQIIAQWPALRLHSGSGGRTWPTGTRHTPPPCPDPTPGCYTMHGFYWPDASEPGHPPPDCYAQVYVDDILMNHGFPTPPFDVSSWFAEQLEGIEWFPSLTTAPARYAGRDGKCGVLVLHTRRTP